MLFKITLKITIVDKQKPIEYATTPTLDHHYCQKNIFLHRVKVMGYSPSSFP